MFALLQFLLDQFGNYLLFIIISLSVELNAQEIIQQQAGYTPLILL